jgi:hypothetical protein
MRDEERILANGIHDSVTPFFSTKWQNLSPTRVCSGVAYIFEASIIQKEGENCMYVEANITILTGFVTLAGDSDVGTERASQ